MLSAGKLYLIHQTQNDSGNMLVKIVLFICLAHFVLSEDANNSVLLNVSPLQYKLQGLSPSVSTDTQVPLMTQTKPLMMTMSTICPANEILLNIEDILTKRLIGDDEKSNNNNLNLFDIQQDNIPLYNGTSVNNEDGKEKIIIPLSKTGLLRQLLENNKFKGNLKTKISVEYELPSDSDVSCKHVLLEILQILRNANTMHEYYRSCGPYDNCPKENNVAMKNNGNNNTLTATINQGNDYVPNELPTSFSIYNSPGKSDLTGSNTDLSSLLKYQVPNKNNDNILSILKKWYISYGTKQLLNVPNDTNIMLNHIAESTNKPIQMYNIDEDNNSKSVPNYPEVLPTNYPYQFITEKILSTIQAPNEYNKQKLNLSEIFANKLLNDNTKMLFLNPINQNTGVDEKPDDVFVTATNDGKIVSIYPSSDTSSKIFETTEKEALNRNFDLNTNVPNKVLADKVIKGHNQQNLPSNVDDLSNTKNSLSNNVNDILLMFKPGQDKSKLLKSLVQSKLQYGQIPQLVSSTNVKHLDLNPFYINPNLIPITNPASKVSSISSIYQMPHLNTWYNKYHTNNAGQLYSNLNLFNQRNHNKNPKAIFQTEFVNANPPFINSKLVDYGKHTSKLYSPYNLANLQRMVGVTNQIKLNSSPDNPGVVELTYMLRRPNPVVYQPVYYVKYRLPYESFINNLRELLQRKPQLRSDPVKLYQELLTVSKVAEVSPNLKGIGQQQLLRMVTNNGALVKTKILKVNETSLDKQLKTVQSLNSNLTPNEIVNLTHLIDVTTENKTDVNKNQVDEIQALEKITPASKIFNENDIFFPSKIVNNHFSEVLT